MILKAYILAFWAISLWSAPAHALGIEDCAGMERIACLWKLTCAKEPNNPNKIIPADCAQNYKDPEAPAPTTAEKTPPPPPKKTPLEQLYYIDLSELENQKLLPDDASGEDIDEDTENQLRGKKSKSKKDEDRETDRKSASEDKNPPPTFDKKALEQMIKKGQGWEEVE